MIRDQLLARDEEIVRIINDDDGAITETEYDALLEEKAIIEAALMRKIDRETGEIGAGRPES